MAVWSPRIRAINTHQAPWTCGQWQTAERIPAPAGSSPSVINVCLLARLREQASGLSTENINFGTPWCGLWVQRGLALLRSAGGGGKVRKGISSPSLRW
eukprot:6865514-Pyramimonas_sp.AAC.1